MITQAVTIAIEGIKKSIDGRLGFPGKIDACVKTENIQSIEGASVYCTDDVNAWKSMDASMSITEPTVTEKSVSVLAWTSRYICSYTDLIFDTMVVFYATC